MNMVEGGTPARGFRPLHRKALTALDPRYKTIRPCGLIPAQVGAHDAIES